MEKNVFLSIVTNVMKGLVSHEKMMDSMYRSGMRGEAGNLRLMEVEAESLDRFIADMKGASEINIGDELLDALVLRYFRNTHYLANIKEEYIDVSSLGEEEINFWKKAMHFNPVSSTGSGSPVQQAGSDDIREAC